MAGTPQDWVYVPRPHEIAIIGNDMLLAALPCRPVQLAHAIIEAGYDWFVPVSWGDELIAAHVTERVAAAPATPMIQVSCPMVRKRLLAAGSDLGDRLISTVSPAVALARYLRALQPTASIRVTYLGSCPGARDPSIDVRVDPLPFLNHLKRLGILLSQQPRVFETMVPPDRRRFVSRPGGVPVVAALAAQAIGARLVTLPGVDLASELADQLLARERVLIDVAQAVGCSCSGAKSHGARSWDAIEGLEPPRSSIPVVDGELSLELDEPLPVLMPAWDRQGRPEDQAPTKATPVSPAPGSPAIVTHRYSPPAASSLATHAAGARRPIAVTPVQAAAPRAIERQAPSADPEPPPSGPVDSPATPAPFLRDDAGSPAEVDHEPSGQDAGDTGPDGGPEARPSAPSVGSPGRRSTLRRPSLTPNGGRVSRAFDALRTRSRPQAAGSATLISATAAVDLPVHPPSKTEVTLPGSGTGRTPDIASEHTLSDPVLPEALLPWHAPAAPMMIDEESRSEVDAREPAGVAVEELDAADMEAAGAAPVDVAEPEQAFRPGRRHRRAVIMPARQRRQWDIVAAVILLLAIGVLLVVMLS